MPFSIHWIIEALPRIRALYSLILRVEFFSVFHGVKGMPSSVEEGDTLERQLRLACTELERRLHAGEDCRVETIIDRNPALASDPNCTIELIYTEYVIRESLGQKPSQDEFLARFPQWRDRLIRQFQIHELLSGDEELDSPVSVESPITPHPRLIADHYEVLDKIGQGAMGVVYRVLDRQLNRVVALKQIRNTASANALSRFRQEAEKMAQLEHPNIVRVYAVGDEKGLPFFSMELAPGGNLTQLIRGNAQPPDMAAQMVETLARAMYYAHKQNIIHRDLKPSNVVLTAAMEPKITDFGLAKTVKEWASESQAEELGGGVGREAWTVEREEMSETPHAPRLTPHDSHNPLTQTGMVLGTPAYMAPEQAAGRTDEIGPRTDVYALGTILYEMLTGRAPFQGTSPMDLIQQVQDQDPRPPRVFNRKLDAELEAVCLKCLEKKPSRRYPSADSLAEDLRRWQRGDRTQAQPRGRLVRAAKWVRRNTSRLLVTAAVGFAAVVTLVVNYFQDPKRPLHQIQWELESKRPVTLIGETGPPKWFQWVDMGPQVTGSATAADVFSISASKIGLLELVPDPILKSFRLSAEVRHDSGSASSEVGIFFGHCTHDGNHENKIHFFSDISIKDVINLRSQFPGNPAARNPWNWNFRYCLNPGGFSQKQSCRLFSDGKITTPLETVGAPGQVAGMADLVDRRKENPRLWHRLVLEVRTQNFQAYCEDEGKIIRGPYTRTDFIELWKKLVASKPDYPADFDPDFSPKGGLGLFVKSGSASFRNVVIEPLGEDN